MTLNRRILKRVHSPMKSPKKNNTSLRKKALIKQWSNDVQFGATSKANLKVVVRIRPQNERESNNNARCIVQQVDKNMMVFDPKEENEQFFFHGVRQRTRDISRKTNKEQKFIFERVFNTDSTNQELYEETTKDLLDTILNGYNCSVFAYGATGSGKTFTMLGKPDYPGITFLTLMELYRRIEDLKEEKTVEVGISYLEVYNEGVRDLLKPGKALNVQESGQHVLVPGLSFHKPKDASDLMQMLDYGNQNRSQHPTDSNAESSRSHAVFQVFVRQQDRTANVKSNVAIAKLSMIDLAGSERGAATGFKGARFREGANINKSLLALGNCINALADGQKHIPYRDSKLTRLLKDSLGGNCRSVMIANISPASTSYEDTFNTLRYANRAKTIKTTLKKNIMNVNQHVSQYVQIVDDLRNEITGLKEKLENYEEKEKEWLSQPERCVTPEQNCEELMEQREEYENKIAILEQDLKKAIEEKCVQAEVPSEEVDIQKRLSEASSERKALRRELLQLESSQREVEFKLHINSAHLMRMSIIEFASYKIKKSISKCERTIRNLNNRRDQAKKLQEIVENKLAVNLDKLHGIQKELIEWGPGSGKLSQASQLISERNDSGIAYRDLHQLADYLRSIINEFASEQSESEQLICHLLNASKQFYLQLRANNQCIPELDNLFESISEKMNESKIIWADQQKDNEDTTSGSVDQPSLDLSRLTILPISGTIFISPATTVEKRTFRRSIIKSSKSKSMSSLIRPNLSNVEEDVPDQRTEHVVVEKERPVAISAPGLSCTHNETPESPVLSKFSAPPETEMEVTTINDVAVTPKEPVLLKNENRKDFGFVSMLGGLSTSSMLGGGLSTSSINLKSNAKLDETELLEDIQPVECSMNATYAITPAKPKTIDDLQSNSTHLNTSTVDMLTRSLQKRELPTISTLNTTLDMPSKSAILNTTIEVSKPSVFNTIREVAKPVLNTTSTMSKPAVLNTTVDMSKPAVLNTTIDMSKPAVLNTTIDMSKQVILNPTAASGPSVLNTTVDMSKQEILNPTAASGPSALNTTVDLGRTVSLDDGSKAHQISTVPLNPPVINLNGGETYISDKVEMPVDMKNAVRRLFSPGMDPTFSMKAKSSADPPQPSNKRVADHSPGCEILSPVFPENSARQFRRETFEMPQPSPVLLKTMKVPVQSGNDRLMPPPVKVAKGIVKSKTPSKTPTRGTTPGKGTIVTKITPGKGTIVAKITPGKTYLTAGRTMSGMRKSLSTSSLVSGNSNIGRPNVQSFSNNKPKLSGLGAALRRTSSFLNKNRAPTGNQENVPPGSHRGLSQTSSLAYRETVSSAARQSKQ